MSKKIKGITIQLEGDSTPLQKALKDVDKASSNTTKELGQINRALKFDEGNTTLLAQKFDVLQDAISNTSTRLETLKKAQAEVDRQFSAGEIDATTYREFQREIEITEGKLKAFRKQADDVKAKLDVQADPSKIDKMKAKLEELGKSAEEVGEKMSSAGQKMTVDLTAPIAAVGTASLLSAAQFDNAAGQIQAALGTTAKEAETLEDVAKNVWKDGFGESLEDVSNALIRVKQNIKGISDDAELEKITKDALALAKTFDSDVNEVTRAANNLMTNFGVSSEQAFDMMAKGAQNGLNFSNEMFDNLAEYAPLWADMGYSIEEMFGVLQAGAESGVYNLDYLNDVMKEFQIRATDGSKSTADAVAELGPQVQKVWKAFSSGEASVADMSKVAVAELSKIDDKVKQNELGVALFGTKWEDLGGDVVLSMLAAGKSLEDFEGAMNDITKVQEQTFGQRWDSFTRTAAASLEPLGKILLDLAEQWLPKIISVVESMTTWFSNLSPVIQTLVVAIGAIGAAIGPVLVVVGTLISSIGSIIPLFTGGGAAAGTLGAAITALTGPIGLVIAAVVALIAIFVTFKDDIFAIWNGHLKPLFDQIVAMVIETLQPAFEAGFNAISEIVRKSFDIMVNLWEGILHPVILIIIKVINGLMPVFQTVFSAIGNTVTTAFNTIKSLWTDVLMPALNGIIDFLNGLFTGNWKKAWEGIVSVFSSIFKGVETAAKTPLNVIIGMINAVIDGLNSLSIDIPDWVPGMGGNTWGINIPKVPMLAKGTDYFKGGFAIVGEEGPELVQMPTGVKVHSNDKTQQMIGGHTFNITIQANDNAEAIAREVERTLRRLSFEF